MTDCACMQLALEQAKQAAAQGEVPVGAILVHNGAVVAQAHNLVEARRDPTAHAELLCLQAGIEALQGKWLSDCTLYVTLEPCAMCAGAMVNARLGRLVFGAFDARCGCCGSALDIVTDAFYHTVPTVGGLMEAECAALLTAFFKDRRA
ncbi:MAG: tRNA adenosine(34) deaminase TadA [Clostridia bacterium]|nr:tRNA adenosine(34) deaminase TadA [Clostridia bacterium]